MWEPDYTPDARAPADSPDSPDAVAPSSQGGTVPRRAPRAGWSSEWLAVEYARYEELTLHHAVCKRSYEQSTCSDGHAPHMHAAADERAWEHRQLALALEQSGNEALRTRYAYSICPPALLRV